MDQITFKRVNTKTAMMLTYAIQILIIVVFVLGMFIFNKKVAKLKNDSYQLFEGMDKQLIKDKEDNCNEFIARYTELKEDEKYDDTKTFIKETNNRQNGMQFYPNATVTKSASEEHTEPKFGDNLFSNKSSSHSNIERDRKSLKLHI